MSIRLAAALAASALTFQAGASLAEPAPSAPAKPSTVSPVTVTAPKPATIHRQALAFTETHAAQTAELQQIARWRDPICVRVFGLVPAAAELVKGRIEEVASAVGQRIAKPGCDPNVQVVFTKTPQALMDSVADHAEHVLGYYHRHDEKRLKTVTRPIQAWYVTATSGGVADIAGLATAHFTGSPPPGLLTVQPNEEVIDDPDNHGPAGCADTPHFSSCLKSVLKNVLIVADASRLEGKNVGLLSDYIAMVALSEPRSLDGCESLASIIDLLAPSGCPGREPPDGLTPADAAYLTSLYASDPEANGAGEEGEIARRMTAMLVKAGAGAAR